MQITDEKELRKIANDVRIDIINEVYSAKSGHPDMEKVPGVNRSTGSLWQVLSIEWVK